MPNASTRRAPRKRDRSAAAGGALPVAEPDAPPAAATEEQQIAQRAYQLWLAEGQPEGRALAHWVQAQRDLALI